ncbi:SEL1-like repeat protein [Actinomadura decatromicini]|uniref:SEL1-like repeat protein n=1 Tax=Actinomadura decatromicini TaxID=2604572 RepID=A0A5D3FK71_9ACTN|nr:SEL1-like repeat protein [Actinomadura decatromicini]TYK48392.1 SEL1-like repeat protein [Actinomadura decatromicini]
MLVRPWSPADLGRPTDGTWADVAFGLGELYEHEGDLEQAADWYRRAAESGRADAALRLGGVLGRMADAGSAADSAEELLAEATRWLSGAHDATTPDAIELITDMLNRQLRRAARRGLEPAHAG